MREFLLSIAALIIVGGFINHMINRSLRTKMLRELLEELNKLTANGSGSMSFRLSEKPKIGGEYTLHGDWVYTWQNTDVQVELTIRQRQKVTVATILTIGSNRMPTWDYGPKSSKRLKQILPELRQILGENDIKVVQDSVAA